MKFNRHENIIFNYLFPAKFTIKKNPITIQSATRNPIST
jgi:hypothetical protein